MAETPTPAALREKLAALMAAVDRLPRMAVDRARRGVINFDGDPMTGLIAGMCASDLVAVVEGLRSEAPTILAALSRDAGADGWRAGAEAMREKTAEWHDHASEAFGLNQVQRLLHKRTAAAIRGLPLPAPPAAQKEASDG